MAGGKRKTIIREIDERNKILGLVMLVENSNHTKDASISLKKDFIYITGLMLIVLSLFVPNLILRTSAIDLPCVPDIASQSYPHSVFMARVYKSLHFPLWDPHSCCGMPFLAFSHNSVFYPLMLIYMLADFFKSSTIIILIQFLITIISTYLLFRYIGRKYLTSVMAAISYTLTGLYFVHINSKVDRTISFAPLMLLATIMLTKGKINKSFITLLVAFTFAFLGGDIESLFLIIMFDFAFLLLLTKPGEWLKLSLIFGLAIAYGLFLCMLQFIPSVEMLRFSVRGQGFQFKAQFNLIRDAFHSIFFMFSTIYPVPMPPDLAVGANPNLSSVYFGFFWWPFFIKNFSAPESRKIRYIFILFLIYIFSYIVPGLSHLRNLIPLIKSFVLPILIFCPISLVFLFMASAGFDNFLSQPSPTISKKTGYFFWIYGLLCLFFGILFKQAPASRILLAILLFSFPLWSKIVKINYAFLIIALVDIYGMALWYFPRSNEPKYKLEPQFLRIAANTEQKERYIVKAIPTCSRIFYGAGMIVKADTIDSNIRVPLKHYADLLALPFEGLFTKKDNKPIFFEHDAWRRIDNINKANLWILNLLNVRWVFSGVYIPGDNPGVDLLLRESGSVYVYENQTALPRAFTVNQARILSSDKEVFDLIASSTFDYRKEILLSDRTAPRLDLEGEQSFSDFISLTRPSADRLDAIVHNHAFCYLFLSEVYYPGWKAFVDGTEARIWKADYAFRAVYLNPGRHYIKFIYAPVCFRLGLYFSLGSILAGLIALSWKYRVILSSLLKLRAR